jgi:hypothetical protein
VARILDGAAVTVAEGMEVLGAALESRRDAATPTAGRTE